MKTILLIEDNPDMRENTAEILELAGYRVLTAENGKMGVAVAKAEKPDLIICDIMMPELDGYGVLRMLGKQSETASIPFIFLTAKAEKTDFRKGMNLGADDYITKPFDEVELLDAIEMRLQKHQSVNKDYESNGDGLHRFLNDVRTLDALSEISPERQTRLYKTREVIFHEGSYPYGLLMINSGKVRCYKTNHDAKEYTTGLFKSGEYFGYLPLLRNTMYEESAMAMEDTEVLIIPAKDFFALLYNNRDVAGRFIRLLSDNLSEKEDELLHLAYDSVRKRVADALVQLYTKFQEKPGQFSMSITRDHLASIVGTSKECVIRVLSDFKEENLVDTHMSEITILNPDKLAKVKY
ncbi:MAG: response regulator [Bacteroidetes bacterium]|nr:MAG: response regulator [Bacteroidota bacterium]